MWYVWCVGVSLSRGGRQGLVPESWVGSFTCTSAPRRSMAAAARGGCARSACMLHAPPARRAVGRRKAPAAAMQSRRRRGANGWRMVQVALLCLCSRGVVFGMVNPFVLVPTLARASVRRVRCCCCGVAARQPTTNRHDAAHDKPPSTDQCDRPIDRSTVADHVSHCQTQIQGVHV